MTDHNATAGGPETADEAMSEELAAGLAVRMAAATIVDEVLRSGQTLDELAARFSAHLEPRDRALARAIATVTFRRLGTLERALAERMPRGLPAGSERLKVVLLTAAAQLLFMDVPDHAVVDCAVELIGRDPRRQGLRGFANAVLRRIARERAMILAESEALSDDTPQWLAKRWIAHYGEGRARAIADAHREEPPLDLTVKSDPAGWAEKLGGIVLATGSVRLKNRAAIETLPGYAEGEWWVQDAAAALPARLLNAKPGERIADFCAAPGGKTAQLAFAGADVTALDRSKPRMTRLAQNMKRLGLSVDTQVCDAAVFESPPFDAVLVDAPCSATGTIRRHPDVAWAKQEEDIGRLAALQARLLDRACDLTRAGGRIVYCTCSLEAEEGEEQIKALLARRSDVRLDPIAADEVGGMASTLTPHGELRTLPNQLVDRDPRLSGWTGFYAARLLKL